MTFDDRITAAESALNRAVLNDIEKALKIMIKRYRMAVMYGLTDAVSYWQTEISKVIGEVVE